MASRRMRAPERREAILEAAIVEFAARGYAGTSVGAIAERVGVSQPYLFQVFATKKQIFLEAVSVCFRRARALFMEEGHRAQEVDPTPAHVLQAMGGAYRRHLGNRELLGLQLQAFAACDDPDIRALVAREMRTTYDEVARCSGADPAALETFFSTGMMLNALAAITPPGEPLRLFSDPAAKRNSIPLRARTVEQRGSSRPATRKSVQRSKKGGST